ncbi:MAG: hypothetical protein B6I20_13075 [Bacteroidetes bacterium 4572_117]|nr:MAG: hypothetical protein B6I20_13075 [Bacteroidetes bacterium 4572_117]
MAIFPFKKKTKFIVLKIIIVLSTYGFMVHKLYNSKEIHGFIKNSILFNKTKVIIIIVVFILMIMNWLLESVKWQILVKRIKSISIKQSLQSVFAGISVGIFTPNRLGEFVGRPFFLDSTKVIPGIFASVVGSISQSLVTILFGISAINFYLFSVHKNLSISASHFYLILTFSVILVFFMAYVFFNPDVLIKLKKNIKLLEKRGDELNFLASYKLPELFKVLLLSVLRYVVFFTQFYLLLLFFDIEIGIYQAFVAIGLIYFFLFVIPGFALSEIGVRGSLAIFFLGMYSNDYTAIFSATISLWVINLALPAILGSFIVINMRNHSDNKPDKI